MATKKVKGGLNEKDRFDVNLCNVFSRQLAANGMMSDIVRSPYGIVVHVYIYK